MDGPFEWYQVLTGFLLVGVVVWVVPVQKFTKLLWTELRMMWRESEDSLWSKLFQTAIFLGGYILFGTAVYYATFRIGAMLFIWWEGTLGGSAVLGLCTLLVLFARHQRAAAHKQKDA